MKVSVSIKSQLGNAVRIGLETADTSFIGESISKHLYSRGIEIIEVVLDRQAGKEMIGLNFLNEISSVVAKLFLENKHSILFYYCDDMNEIPHCNHCNMLPQEYRSKLFSQMFSRYVTSHNIDKVHDTTICVNAVDRPLFFHFISHKDNLDIINDIQEDFSKTYSK